MKPVPVETLVNSFEFEEAAKEKLAPERFRSIAGSDRKPFDRITLRPRMMVDTRKLDLSVELFGSTLVAPIIAQGMDSWAGQLAKGDEAAVARGASEARTALITGSVAAAKGMQHAPAIFRVSGAQVAAAVDAGAKAAVMGLVSLPRKQAPIPLIASGVRSANDARRAVDAGASAVWLSKGAMGPHPMSVLPMIVEAVAGKAPVLIGGDFRRGTDILKALALGAKAVVVTRPTAWALASYGSDGVEALYLMLMAELARNMAMCGKVNLAALGPDVLKIHGA